MSTDASHLPTLQGATAMVGITIKGPDGELLNHLIRRDFNNHWLLAKDGNPFGSHSSVGKLVQEMVEKSTASSEYFGIPLIYSSQNREEASFTTRQPGEVVKNPLFEREALLDDGDEDSSRRPLSITSVDDVTQALEMAQLEERKITAKLQEAEATYDNLYGALPFDESRVSSDKVVTSPARAIAHEIAMTKASIDSQKSELLRVKANRVRADEVYMGLQDELRLLIADLEATEREYEARRARAVKLESLDKVTATKITEKQQVQFTFHPPSRQNSSRSPRDVMYRCSRQYLSNSACQAVHSTSKN